MRIIAGTAHGQIIKAPAGRNTRPTTDRVREAIFSALTPFLAGAYVLDAFAGSGALGLEALSRGAAGAVFCEQARPAQLVIKENLRKLGFADRAILLGGAAEQKLQHWPDEAEKKSFFNKKSFDIVLLDPPYNQGLIEKIEPLLLREGFLAPGALVMLETASRQPELLADPRWRQLKNRVYGDTAVYYWELQN